MRIRLLLVIAFCAATALDAQVANFPMRRGPVKPKVSPTGPNPFAAAATYTRALWLSDTASIVLIVDPRELAATGLSAAGKSLHDAEQMRAVIAPGRIALATVAEAESCRMMAQMSACPARLLMAMGRPMLANDTGSMRVNLRSIEPDSTGRCARTANVCVMMTDWIYHLKRADGSWSVVSFEGADLATTMGAGGRGGNRLPSKR